MDADDPVLQAVLEAIDESASPMRQVAVVCLQTSPVFLVSINGIGSVPAEQLAGQSFAVDDAGRAWWSPPSKPICFKVT